MNVLYGTRFTDLCYGYNAMRAEALPALALPAMHVAGQDGGRVWGDGFEIETLMNLRAAHAHLRTTEVASIEAERLHGVSNLNAVTDGLRVLRTIVRERMRRSRPVTLAPRPTYAEPAPAPVRRVVAVNLLPELVDSEIDLTDDLVDVRQESDHLTRDGLAEKLS